MNRPAQARHAEYARRLAAGEVASDIYRDLYPRSRAWKVEAVHQMASKLSTKVAPRVKAIQQAAEDKTIMDRREIMQLATKIARGTVADFVTAGADGVVTNVGPENVNSPALKSVKTRVICSGKGDNKKDVGYVTDLEVRDPLSGAEMLNKMRHEYDKKEVSDKPLVIVLREREAPIRSEKPAIEMQGPKRITKHRAT